MSERRRHTIVIGFVVLISLTLLAAPARGDDWFSLYIGSAGFGFGLGSTDWGVYGSSWSNPGWSVDSHVALSGYGEWVWIDGLGQCWRPWVRPDWRPFTHGRWVWTVSGWTWIAYEPWGYFPHHFGHWAMSPFGWVWHPGTTYFAANVVWVSTGGWVGWYPSPPRGWSHSHRGFRSGYAHGHRDGYASGYRDGAADGYWAGWDDARYATYVGWDRLGDDDLGRHAVDAAVVRRAGTQAAPRAVMGAPDRAELARRGVTVPAMPLERRTARVDGRDVVLARPAGAAESVGRNARTAVERTLAPAAAETLSRRSVPRSGSAAPERRAPAGIDSADNAGADRGSGRATVSSRSVPRTATAPIVRPQVTESPRRSERVATPIGRSGSTAPQTRSQSTAAAPERRSTVEAGRRDHSPERSGTVRREAEARSERPASRGDRPGGDGGDEEKRGDSRSRARRR